MNFLVKDLINPSFRPPLKKLDFHHIYRDSFKSLSIKNGLFDTIFIGASGSGKLTLIFAYLQHIFGEEVLRLIPNEFSDKSKVNVKKNKGNSKDFLTEINFETVESIYSNNYITLINDSVPDDKLLEYLRNQVNQVSDNVSYLVITHIDRFKPKTLSFLKSFIEQRETSLYVLATSCSIQKISNSLRGLLSQYWIARPSLETTMKYYLKIIPDKFIKANTINKDKFKKIYIETHGNLKLIISYINQYLLGAIDPDLVKKHPNSYRLYLCSLLNLAIKGDMKDLNMIRSMMLVVYQYPVSWREYTHHFLDLIGISKLSSEKKVEIVEMIADVDHKVALSKVNYCHYEALVFQLMSILHS
jgi:hypothetical protein